MPFDEYDILESAIRITEERDKRSLDSAFVKALSELIQFNTLILLHVPRNTDSDYLEVAASVPEDAYKQKLTLIPHEYGDQRVKMDDTFIACRDRHEPISVKLNGTNRTLLPIIVNRNVSGILDMYGHHADTNTKNLIRGFIRIYSNILAIIDDNEHDTLTGLLNRKTFDAQLTALFSVSSSKKNPLSIVENERRTTKKDLNHWVGIMDIDHFKRINDNYGHVYGDEVLLLFANLMRQIFRSSDLLFRYGGEEFVAVLAPTTESDAFVVFERFRQALEQFDFPRIGRVTVSIGMVKIDARDHPTTVIECADQALYYAKEHGRNQVCKYRELTEAGLLKVRQVESDVELFSIHNK